MDDGMTEAQIGESEAQARYMEFAKKGKMTLGEFDSHMGKSMRASARADWTIMLTFMGSTIAIAWIVAAIMWWKFG